MKPTLEMLIENRKIIARSILTIAYYAIIFYILRLLFFYKINPDQKDMLVFVLGALIGSFGKVTDWWFPKHDEDDKKSDGPK